MKHFLVTLIFLYAVVTSSYGTKEEDQQAATCCTNLGIEGSHNPFGSSRTTFNNCCEQMKKLIKIWTYNTIELVTNKFGDQSSVEKVTEAMELFKNKGWSSDMALQLVQKTSSKSSDKVVFIRNVMTYGEKEYWSPIIEYMGKDLKMFHILRTILPNNNLKMPFAIYVQWALNPKNNGRCSVDNLDVMITFLHKKTDPTKDQDKYYKIFDSICEHSGNKSLDTIDLWNDSELLMDVVSEAKKANVSVDHLAVFLKHGAGIVKVLKAQHNYVKELDWNLTDIFARLANCQKGLAQPTADAIRGAINLHMKKTFYDKVTENSRSKNVDRVQFLHFIGIIGLSKYNIDSKEKYEDLFNFLINAYQFQSLERQTVKSKERLDIIGFFNVTREHTVYWRFKLQELSTIIAIAKGKMKVGALAEFINVVAQYSCINVTDKILLMVPFYYKLGLTNKAIWSKVLSINKIDEYQEIRPYEYYEIHQEIEKTRKGGADNAIKYFFENDKLVYCKSQVVKCVAEYDAATANKFDSARFASLYNTGCKQSPGLFCNQFVVATQKK